MKMNRWIPAIAGTIILLFAGLVYAWSTMSVPIAQEYPQWLEAQRALTFTLLIIFFCLGGLVNGMIAKKGQAPLEPGCLGAAVFAGLPCQRPHPVSADAPSVLWRVLRHCGRSGL